MEIGTSFPVSLRVGMSRGVGCEAYAEEVPMRKRSGAAPDAPYEDVMEDGDEGDAQSLS